VTVKYSHLQNKVSICQLSPKLLLQTSRIMTVLLLLLLWRGRKSVADMFVFAVSSVVVTYAVSIGLNSPWSHPLFCYAMCARELLIMWYIQVFKARTVLDGREQLWPSQRGWCPLFSRVVMRGWGNTDACQKHTVTPFVTCHLLRDSIYNEAEVKCMRGSNQIGHSRKIWS
jgi:hypothetical protein